MDERGKSQPCYNLTRDGFSFLAMGFTGKDAAHKEKTQHFRPGVSILLRARAYALTTGVKLGVCNKANGTDRIHSDPL